MVIAQAIILSGYTSGAVIQVADAQILTAQRNHGAGTKTKALGTQDSGFDHIQSGF